MSNQKDKIGYVTNDPSYGLKKLWDAYDEFATSMEIGRDANGKLMVYSEDLIDDLHTYFTILEKNLRERGQIKWNLIHLN